MMGHGNGRGYGMGPGYGRQYGPGEGRSYGPGMMGPGYGPRGSSSGERTNENLTVDGVRNELDRWIVAQANPNIKVGAVTEKDTNTIVADVVTKKEDALVQRFEIDRTTGAYRPAGS
jgi:hypothetical protein